MTQQEKTERQKLYIKAQRDILGAIVSEPEGTQRNLFNLCRPEFFTDEQYIYNPETGKSSKKKLGYKKAFNTCREILEAGEKLDILSLGAKIGYPEAAELITGESSLNLHIHNEIEFVASCYIEDEKEKLGAALSAGSISPQDYATKITELYGTFTPEKWRSYLVTDAALEAPDTPPLITRNGDIYLCRGELLKISGHKGNKKSFLALTIAAAAINAGARIDKTLGFTTDEEGLKVLYIDTELPRRAYKSRLQTFKKITQLQRLPEKFYYMNLNGVSPENKESYINSFVAKIHPDIIVYDSIRDFVEDFNDPKEATRIKDYLKRLAETEQLGIIVTIHLNDDSKKGADDGNNKGHLGRFMADYCDLGIKLNLNDDEERSTKVTFDKIRNAAPEEFSFIYNSNTSYLTIWEPTADSAEEYKQEQKARELFTEILENSPGMRYGALKAALIEKGINKGKAEDMLAKKNGKNSKTYRGIIVQERNGIFTLIPPGAAVDEEAEDMPLF